MAAIEASGYTTPTPIQAAAIPVALTGKDVLGIAQTGTGKTAAFTMPMISRLETGRARARMPRSLILAPTRELAAQVAQSFEKYGVNHKLTLALLIGGVSMDDQVKKLDRGVDVLIATPGRLLDHFGRGRVMLMGVEILVIDEADRMLDMGFIPDIEKICRLLPPKRQTLFFSATMPPEITRLADQFLRAPERIEVAKPATTAKTITQLMRFCSNGEDWAKREELRQLIRGEENLKNAIIFCNRKRDVAILLKSLMKHGFNAGALHGDMDQKSRMETLDRFRSGEITFLAASDVAARGLDIPDVSHVINFDLPWQSDDYVHRIGRTGRAGRSGRALSLVTPDDLKLLDSIVKITGDTPDWIGEPPSEDDYAGAGRRKRGRGGRGNAGRDRAHQRTGRDKPRVKEIPGQGPQPDVSFESVAANPASAAPAGEAGAPAEETGRKRRRRGRGNRSGGEAAAATPARHEVAGETTPRAPAPTQRREAPPAPRETAQAQVATAPRRTPVERAEPRRGEATRGAPQGFADNVPAFLRRPVPSRQKKVAG